MDSIQFKEQTLRYLRNISDCMASLVLPAADVPGLTLTGLLLLIELDRSPDGMHTVGSLGRRLHMASSNASALCKSLEKKGLITRKRSNKDERVVHVLLTENGLSLMQRMESDINERFGPTLQREPEENIEAILDGMGKLCALLERMLAEGKEGNTL